MRQHTRHTNKRRMTIGLTAAVAVLLGVGTFFVMERRTDAPHQELETESHQTIDANDQTKPAQEQPDGPDNTTHSTTDPTSIWVIVNKQHPLDPRSYAPSDLTDAGNGQLMRNEAATALTQLRSAAQAAGNPVYALSGYRSYATQTAVYNNYVQADGQAAADTYSARPGYSEHQTGLAVDVGNGTCDIEVCFGNTSAGTWLAANAYTYGFIIRYTADKIATTGYQYEPWHIRYVGVELATQLHTNGISTLEEYFGVAGGTSY